MDGSYLKAPRKSPTSRASPMPPPSSSSSQMLGSNLARAQTKLSVTRHTSTPSGDHVAASVYPHFLSPNDQTSGPSVSVNSSHNGHETSLRIQQIITNIHETQDKQLKIKEEYLQHLKNIDLNKYSFPNETLPKTDYTYAKTSSYRSSENADDKFDIMPNLCRRARRSPSNQFAKSNVKNMSMLNSFFGGESLSESACLNTSLFNRLKNLFSRTKIANDESRATSSSQIDASKRQVMRNLENDLNEVNDRPVTRSMMTVSKNKSVSFNENSTNPTQTAAAVSNGTISSSTNARTHETCATQRNRKRKGSGFLCGIWSCLVPLLLILLLLAPILYVIMREPDFEARKDFLVQSKDHVIDEFVWPAWSSTQRACKRASDSLTRLLGSLPSYFYFIGELVGNKSNELSARVHEAVKQFQQSTYRSSSNGNNKEMFSSVGNGMNDDRNREFMINDLNQLKEKIIQETLTNFKEINMPDVELIRKELDQKFNYTLTLMSSKLADQSVQLEKSKSTYENELKEMKDVVNELETRYKFILSQLQESQMKEKQRQDQFDEATRVAQQAAKMAQEALQSQSQSHRDTLAGQVIDTGSPSSKQLRDTLSADENISFQKIEEYINRTFFLYNADRTGMTDFASESIGGSILFTRCTETYKDNSRWFTVFDVPITRITVSPRVVIQGSMQPGNCWAFKGSKADLFIKLAARIKAKSFSIEHIPKELSLTGTIDSAPQNFTIYGYSNANEISDDLRLPLGTFRYNNESKSTLQFFDVQMNHDKPIAAVELKIESNSGNKEYTCLYKFRVHGELYKKPVVSSQESNQNEPVDMETPGYNHAKESGTGASDSQTTTIN